MLEIERVGLCKLVPYPLIHGIYVGLVDSHTPLGKRGGIIYWNVMEIGVIGPVFIKNEKKLLGSPEGESRDEDTAALGDGGVNDFGEAFLTGQTWLVELNAVRGLDDTDVRGELGDLGSEKVTILLTGVVARV